MTLSGKEKAALRGEAHHLTALVHVGKEGLTPTVFQSLDDALRTRELVKVQLGKTVENKPRDVSGLRRGLSKSREAEGFFGRLRALFSGKKELSPDLAAQMEHAENLTATDDRDAGVGPDLTLALQMQAGDRCGIAGRPCGCNMAGS